MNISNIFESAKKDDVLNLDVDEILNNLDLENKGYLENRKIESLLEENNDAISKLNGIDEDNVCKLCNKLKIYRFVDEIYDLHLGKHVRWIRKSDPEHKLKVGGIVVDIKFLDLGTHILIFNKYISKKPIQYKFDDVLTFQKLSDEEQLILFVQ
jgi:hypothetical protein